MNFFELIEQSRIGREQAQKLKESISTNVRYEFIDRIDKVLRLLDENQQEIIKLKFNNFGSMGQLHDKLSEILVAYRFLDKNPNFCDDAKGDPDLLLKETNEYIEVKRLNNSDFQNNTVEFMLGYCKKPEDNELGNEEAVYIKARELIDRAIRQLKDKRGYIFLVYSIDILNFINPLSAREEKFEKIVQSYFDAKKPENISFVMVHIDELYGSRYLA